MIVDAFQNPYLASDLATFDQGFGLPAADFTNTVMPGTPAFDPNDDNQVGWGEESTLDVLWAHAIAPGAKIRLISAASNNDTDILAATQYAVDNNLGDVLSQSFGENENCVDPTLLAAEHQMFAKAKNAGVDGLRLLRRLGSSAVHLRRQRGGPGRQQPGVRPAGHRRGRHHPGRGHQRHVPG